jgi:hypothetical protein
MNTARKWPPEADTILTDPETGLPVLTESLDIDHGNVVQIMTPHRLVATDAPMRRWDVTLVCFGGGIEHVSVWAASRDLACLHALQTSSRRVLHVSACAPDEDGMEAVRRECDRASLRAVMLYAVGPAVILGAVVLLGRYADDIVQLLVNVGVL